tara:strand:+ start:290 stop:718 length:429 start_codon:yes stop_codon:yes gene_type:complete
MVSNNSDITMLLDAYSTVRTSSLITEIDERVDVDVPDIRKIEIDSISNVDTGIPTTRELYRSNNIITINSDDNNLIVKGKTSSDDIITILKNKNNDEVTIDVVSDGGANLFTYTGRNEGPDSYIQLPLTDGRFGLLIKQQDV